MIQILLLKDNGTILYDQAVSIFTIHKEIFCMALSYNICPNLHHIFVYSYVRLVNFGVSVTQGSRWDRSME